jgi:pyruvate,water dikinase
VRTIAWLDGTTRFGRERIGRKGVAISFLKESGQAVPNTFVVTSDAFVGFLTENNLRSRLVRMMESLGRIDAYELRNLSQDAQKLVREARIPWDMEIDLINSYKRISHESGVVEEDMILRPSVSLGGDREWGLEERIGSLVNVKGEKALIEGVKEVWARSLSGEALRFLTDHQLSLADLRVAVVVQGVVAANSSGTAATRDPAYGEGKMVVRAVLGLGTPLRNHQINPDTFVIDLSDMSIADRMISDQMWSYAKGHNESDGTPRRMEVDVFYQSRAKLSDGMVADIARTARAVEAAAGEPVEVDFAVDPAGVQLLDFRRLAELEILRVPPEAPPSAARTDRPGFPPPATSAAAPSPASAPASAGSGGDSGGAWDMFALSPAAEESAPAPEPGRPSPPYDAPPYGGAMYGEPAAARESASPLYTAGGAAGPGGWSPGQPGTRLMMHMDAWKDRDRLDEAGAMPCDGVAVLGLEGVWTDTIRTHPQEIVRQRQDDRAVDALRGAMVAAGRAFAPRPVIVRMLDLDSTGYRRLMGGPSHEREEDNPALGLRGASRFIQEDQRRAARLELRALARARQDDGLTNLHLAIPSARTLEELDAIEALLDAEELDRDGTLAVFPVIETPSGVYMIADLQDRCDGVIVDAARLNAAILGIDPGISAFGSGEYLPENNAALYETLELAISVACDVDIDAVLTGLSPSDTGLIELGIEAGVDAFAASPREFSAMSTSVERAERRFLMERLREGNDRYEE